MRPTDPAFDELLEASANGDLVVVSGAGVSIAAGLPSREHLVEMLLQRGRQRQADAERLKEIEDLAGKGRIIDALSAAKQTIGENEFCTLVERKLDDRGLHVPADALRFMGDRLHRDYWTAERAVEAVDRFAISERARLSLPTVRRALMEAKLIGEAA